SAPSSPARQPSPAAPAAAAPPEDDARLSGRGHRCARAACRLGTARALRWTRSRRDRSARPAGALRRISGPLRDRSGRSDTRLPRTPSASACLRARPPRGRGGRSGLGATRRSAPYARRRARGLVLPVLAFGLAFGLAPELPPGLGGPAGLRARQRSIA